MFRDGQHTREYRGPCRVLYFLIVFCVQTTAATPGAEATNATGSSKDSITPGTLNKTSDGRIIGWVSQPNFRGTFDILWTSLVTIFICTYTMLNLNVPSPRDNWLTIQGRRLKWMCLAIIGPEFVLTYAAGQWSRARHSVEAFHAKGYMKWSMRLAFFADMGGFVLCARDYPPFPLNAKHLYWLIEHKYIEFPNVTDEEMWDKSKQDKLAKIITSVQIGYLVVQCIGRAVQNLAISTLELNALAIVVTSLITSYFWLQKPLDVRTPIHITADINLEEITQSRPWKLTPLDFVDENGPGWAVNIQPFMKLPVIPAERPIQRIPNDRFPMNPYGIQEYLLCFATLLFTAVHVAGWNFAFPSRIEQILWRVASMLLFGITATFWILETMASWKRLGRWKLLASMWNNLISGLKKRRAPSNHHDEEKTTSDEKEVATSNNDEAEKSTDRFHGSTTVSTRPLAMQYETPCPAPTPDSSMATTRTPNSQNSTKGSTPSQPPTDYIPTVLPLPWEFWTITPLALSYGIARFYLIIEAFLELRNMQATAFIDVNWSDFVPHV